jgi:hypothetical protein
VEIDWRVQHNWIKNWKCYQFEEGLWQKNDVLPIRVTELFLGPKVIQEQEYSVV